MKWVDTMKNAINVTEVGQQPSLDASFSLAYFFVAYICIGTIFLVNLLLGVLVRGTYRIEAKKREKQNQWGEGR